jgi:hypothetical protein
MTLTPPEPPNPAWANAVAVTGAIFVAVVVFGLAGWWLVDLLRERRDARKAAKA